MAARLAGKGGPESVGTLTVDADGYRSFKAAWKVETAVTDGPLTALSCPGLPTVGSTWAYRAESDPWSWCRPEATVTPVEEPGPTRFYRVERLFSNKPYDRKRCADTQIDDPLLEPMKVSGSSVRYTEESQFDRFGRPITMSSFEPIKGSAIEFDKTRAQIKIEQNVPALQLALCESMRDRVSDRPMWGLPRRCVKLSDFSWDQLFYGRCYRYYRRSFTLDTNVDTFDRDVQDVSAKVLSGHWNVATGAWVLDNVGGEPPNRFNPTHFIQAKDFQGENCLLRLNGRGVPADAVVTNTDRYLSWNTEFVFNQGNPLSDPDHWTPVVGPVDSTIPDWDRAVPYVRGNVVRKAGGLHLAINNSQGVEPGTLGVAEFWASLAVTTLTDGSIYSAASDYPVGTYVTSGVSTVPGTIHVERYQEANLFLLGLPLTL